MADRGGDFSFFQGMHVKIDKRIDISISIRPMTRQEDTSGGVNSNNTNQAVAGDVITLRSHDKLQTYFHYQSVFGHQTWQDVNLA